MSLRHTQLEAIADAIVNRISRRYIGLHLRVGDGEFSERREETIQETWSSLQKIGCAGLDGNATTRFSGVHSAASNSTARLQMSHFVASQDRYDDQVTRFSRLQSSCGKLFTPIFISTDLRHPKTDPSLLPFRQMFPSVYFISDFQDELQTLRAMHNRDGVELYQYLLPFLEAMVVAHGHIVVGTRRSTFSKFIEHTLWPAYHRPKESNSRISRG